MVIEFLQQFFSILKNYFYIIFFFFEYGEFCRCASETATPQRISCFVLQRIPKCNTRYCFYLIFKILSACASMSFSAKVFVLRSMGHAPVGLSFNKGSNAVYHKRSLRSAMAGRLYKLQSKHTSNSGFDQTFMPCSSYILFAAKQRVGYQILWVDLRREVNCP